MWCAHHVDQDICALSSSVLSTTSAMHPILTNISPSLSPSPFLSSLPPPPPPPLVSSPDPDSQQLRVDYITATWKVGLGNKNDVLVPRVPQCLCPKIVRQSKFRTNLAQLYINKRYHFRMILLRVLCTII